MYATSVYNFVLYTLYFTLPQRSRWTFHDMLLLLLSVVLIFTFMVWWFHWNFALALLAAAQAPRGTLYFVLYNSPPPRRRVVVGREWRFTVYFVHLTQGYILLKGAHCIFRTSYSRVLDTSYCNPSTADDDANT